MNIDDAFPSTYLKAADLKGHSVEVIIDRIDYEEVGDGKKPVAYFVGKERGLVLNVTNSVVIRDRFGTETDDWHGKTIFVYPTKTSFRGELVDCLRVRLPDEPEPQPMTDDNIPF